MKVVLFLITAISTQKGICRMTTKVTVTLDIVDGGSHETLFNSIGSGKDFQIKLGLRLRLRSAVDRQKWKAFLVGLPLAGRLTT
jgi:hypothetical protein